MTVGRVDKHTSWQKNLVVLVALVVVVSSRIRKILEKPTWKQQWCQYQRRQRKLQC